MRYLSITVFFLFLFGGSLISQDLKVAGDVGIGTENPAARIHIRSTASDGLKLLNFAENDNLSFFFEAGFAGVGETGNTLRLQTFGSNFTQNAMTWRGDGNVGIGVLNPAAKLQILDGNNNTGFNGGYLLIGSTTTGQSNLGIDRNSIQARLDGGINELLLNPFGGDVGINVSDAQDDFHVGGNVRIDGRLDINAGATNIFIGRDVAPSFSPQESVIIGYRAGNSIQQNLSLTTLVGKDAGRLMTSGLQNTALGGNAAEAVTTESFGVYVGAFAGEITGADDAVFVGYDANSNARLSNVTAIGAHAMVTGSDRIALGNVATRAVQGYANFGSVSDARFKTHIREDVAGLAFIEKLRPVSYRLDAPKLDAHIRRGISSSDEVDRTSYNAALQRRAQESHIGFLAQDVEQAARELGFEFSGLITPENDNDHYGLRYAEFVVPLVKGMQEQQEDLRQKTQDIRRLEAENQALQNRLADLENLVQQLLDQDSEDEAPVILNQVPSLEQNEPNPFHETTRIGYFLPAETSAKGGYAQLIITSVDGKELQRISLPQKGQGQIDLHTDNLPAGTYQYSLVVKGQVVATRRMVVQ